METRFYKEGNKVCYKGGLGVINLGKELKRELDAITILPVTQSEDTIGFACTSLYYYVFLENSIRCFNGTIEVIKLNNSDKEVEVSTDLNEIEPANYYIKEYIIPKLRRSDRQDKEKLVKICEDYYLHHKEDWILNKK